MLLTRGRRDGVIAQEGGMSGQEGEFGLAPVDEAPNVPRVVEEAHEVLSAYAWQALAAGGAAVLAWLGTGMYGIWLSPLWLILALVLLLVVFLVPVTREPRLAREVIRRWDQLRVERALASSGVSSDPRFEVAESMADRIVRHPAVDERTRRATRSMVVRLHRLLDDLRRVSYLTQSQFADERVDVNRSVSDLQDLLDARVADILVQLAQLHRTVVLRDSASLDRVVTGVEDLVRELEAERDVERLLSNAEQGA
jgi:hypothetical protein